MVLDAAHVESWQLAGTGNKNKYNTQQEAETRVSSKSKIGIRGGAPPPWWWWF
jgi:hypothetical protein